MSGKVCAVVGGSSGIGLAVARQLVGEGAQVIALARDQPRLTAAVRTLGACAMGISADISDPAAVRTAFDTIDSRFGRLDALFNVAGVARLTRLEDASDEDIAYVFGTNLLGPMYTTRAAIALMRTTGGGTIVNVSSEITLDVMPYNGLYGVSKGGLNAFTTTVNRELRGSGIRVCLIVQGLTEGTSFGDNYTEAELEPVRRQWEADGFRARVAGRVPMTPESVAEALVFVATRPSGQMLDVMHVRAAG